MSKYADLHPSRNLIGGFYMRTYAYTFCNSVFLIEDPLCEINVTFMYITKNSGVQT